MKNDPANKSVVIELSADWNEHRRYAEVPSRTEISDFNGYWGGGMTIIAPTGWSVKIGLSNSQPWQPQPVCPQPVPSLW